MRSNSEHVLRSDHHLLHKRFPLHLPYFHTSAAWNSPKILQSPEPHPYPTLQSQPYTTHPNDSLSNCVLMRTLTHCCYNGILIWKNLYCLSVCVDVGCSCFFLCRFPEQRYMHTGSPFKTDSYVVFSSLNTAAVGQREIQHFKSDLHTQRQAIIMVLNIVFKRTSLIWRH